MGMRERTPFPQEVLERLPNLRLLITSGRGNASFDLEAATELGVVVCGTDGAGEGPTELTWDSSSASCARFPWRTGRPARAGGAFTSAKA